MKTLHLTNSWHETSGGIATFYRALIAAAGRRGHQIRLIVPGERDHMQRIGEHAIIYQLKASRAPFNSDYRTLSPRSYFYPGSAIQRILQEERPELIEVCDKYNLHYLGGLLRSRLMQEIDQRPTTVGLSCERMDENYAAYVGSSRAGEAFCRWYMRWVYFAFFDHHIAISRHTGEELRAVSDGHAIERAVWLRSLGVETETFRRGRENEQARASLLRRLGLGERCRLLLYFGRLAPEKNLPLLLETMKKLRSYPEEMVLLIIGDGMERAAMERQAAAERLPVRFLGHVGDREELAGIAGGCELFLHPNPREPFGLAPLEAMAAGVVLVAPNSGGVTEYANGHNASLVAPTAEAFAAAVRELLGDRELLRAKSRAAVATAETFNRDRMADAYLDLYATIDAVTRGRLPLSEAGVAFRSTAPAASGRRAARAVAGVFENGFRAWVRFRALGAATGSTS